MSSDNENYQKEQQFWNFRTIKSPMLWSMKKQRVYIETSSTKVNFLIEIFMD